MEEYYRIIISNLKQLGWYKWKKMFFLILFIIIIVIAISSSLPLNEDQSYDILKEFENNLPEIGTQPIFTNNFFIASIMMIPIFGVALGIIVLQTTGIVIAATGMSININGIFLLISLFILPFTWLEFISYAAAMTQSIYIALGLFRKNLKKEIVRTMFLLIMIFLMLLLAAITETFTIHLM